MLFVFGILIFSYSFVLFPILLILCLHRKAKGIQNSNVDSIVSMFVDDHVYGMVCTVRCVQ